MRMLHSLLALVAFLFSRACAETLSDGTDSLDYVRNEIAKADVTVFGKSHCLYCRNSQFLLEEFEGSIPGWTLNYINLDQLPGDDGSLIQTELLQFSGQRTVPNVFALGHHLGGHSDLERLHTNGKLQQILQLISSKGDAKPLLEEAQAEKEQEVEEEEEEEEEEEPEEHEEEREEEEVEEGEREEEEHEEEEESEAEESEEEEEPEEVDEEPDF